MMNDLEKYIRNHRAEFDDAEPDPGHFRRFEERVHLRGVKSINPFNRPFLLKIAALILLLITVSVLVFDLTTRGILNRWNNAQASVEFPQEVKEVIMYYDNQATQQLLEISRLAGSTEEAKKLTTQAMKDVSTLDDNTGELKRAFSENTNQERILTAIIQNQQMKENILTTVITQLNQFKQ